ncbi:MAG: cell division protein FtsL [Aquabacterium sp.]|uniref:cell division protein FtsL n=1 Tax=Aquabacterium sp. TaxID=1872578 RepID=UPI003BEA1CAE
MGRLNLILAAVVLLSCFWLIRSSYEARSLFVELDKAQSHAHELQIDYERLQVEKRAQATSLRVEKLAREKLRMFSHNPSVTHYVVAASGVALAASQGGQP